MQELVCQEFCRTTGQRPTEAAVASVYIDIALKIGSVVATRDAHMSNYRSRVTVCAHSMN